MVDQKDTTWKKKHLFHNVFNEEVSERGLIINPTRY